MRRGLFLLLVADSVNIPIPREDSSRGGKAKTAAKLDALARTQAKKRAADARRRAALIVPAGFSGLADFLAVVAELSGKRLGGRTECARAAGVDGSTFGKWIRPNARRAPSQKQLDGIVKWHAGLLGLDAVPAPKAAPSVAGGTIRHARQKAYKLPDPINERLVLTASRRHVSPEVYLAQILDRQLPSLIDLTVR